MGGKAGDFLIYCLMKFSEETVALVLILFAITILSVLIGRWIDFRFDVREAEWRQQSVANCLRYAEGSEGRDWCYRQYGL